MATMAISALVIGLVEVSVGNTAIGVPDITASLAKVTANGGKIHAPRFEVKGVVVLGLFFDPAGNRMGLVEMGPDGRNKVP